MKILFWIATFVKHKEIKKRILNEFNVSLSLKSISNYATSEQYEPVIRKIRDRWGSDLLHVELANKRRRMEELERIYAKCVATNQMKNALTSLYQIKGETEKDLDKIGTQTNYQINIFKDMSEEELEQERVKSLERIKMLRGEASCHAEKDVKEAEVVEVQKVDGNE